MKKTLLLLFFLIWQQIINPQHIYADIANVTLNIAPNRATLGDQINVTVTNIPKGAATYTLSVGRLSTQKTIDNGQKLNFAFFDINNSCTTSGEYKKNIWLLENVYCIPDANGNSLTFTVNVDTNNLGANQELNTTSSVTYGISLTSLQSTQHKADLKEFIIDAPKNQVTDTFDFAQQPFSPNPAKPEDELSIIINAKEEGNYTPYIQKYSTGDLRGTSKRCAVGNCTLTIKIPNDIKTSTIEIAVEDFNGYRKTEILTINNPNASPTSSGLQVQITPIPSPTPATIPALLPCAEGTDITGNLISETEIKNNPERKRDIVKCTKIDSAIGSIATDPADFVKFIFTVLLSMAGGWAVYLIVAAGYQLMFSQGEAEAVKEAQEKITSAIVGIVFMILSLVILRVIGVDIFHLPGFG